jgi:ParB-like chromosome segregation protein Spo0J
VKKIKQFDPNQIPTEIKLVPVEELKLYLLNAKKHPQSQIELLKRSIDLTGFDQPVVANKRDMSIIKGHGRLEAAIQKGWPVVPAIIVDVSPDVADKARLLDNKSAEGEYDIEKLLKELTRFQDDIDATGYGREELDKLLMELESQTVGIEVVESEYNSETFVPEAEYERDAEPEGMEPKEQKEGVTKEIDVDSFSFNHQCPKCGFEYND